MTQNLRILNVKINSSTQIDVTFTDKLTTQLVPANVSILSQTPNVPDSQALKVSVVGNMLSITCQPLTMLAAYFLQFSSTTLNPFISVNGTAKIPEDGVANRTLITGPMAADNPVANYLGAFFQNNIYDLSDTNNVVAKYVQSLSINLSRALYDIRQTKNENYLSFTITDEQKTRSSGPFDRLNEESAYEVIRVGRGPSAANANMTMSFDEFPYYPVTLQRQAKTEVVKASSEDQIGTFNINTLTFNLGNNPITKVNSISFILSTATPNFTYDISTLGYQLENSYYDQELASSYLLLESNQVKISDKILSDPDFALDKIFNITISYEYKSLGRKVNSASLDVYTTLQSIREVLPPIVNIFSLKNAPVTNSNNDPGAIGNVIFTDPNSNIGAPHPAFITEIPFRLNALPYTPGQYAIDYATATVYVYGSGSANDGTGPSPPLATYYYKFTYSSEIDYVIDPDTLDLVALPNGSLIGFPGIVNFNFEQILVPGLDYVANMHQESLNERVENRLSALNTLTTVGSPITDVFQIYNETSGEIYALDRWNDNKVYFKYSNPPRVLSEIGENVSFQDISNELLCVNNTMSVGGSTIFVIYLSENNIIASTQDCVGASFNTAVSFTDGYVFKNEIWYDREFGATVNVQRLSSVGQYMVDYVDGIVYVSVSSTQDFEIGAVSYKSNSIKTDMKHIVSVNDIYYRISPLNPKNKQFSYVSFTDNNAIPSDLDFADEGFLNRSTEPYQVYNGSVGIFIGTSFTAGVTNQIKYLRSIFEFNDLSNNINPINFAPYASFNGNNIVINKINRQSFENVQFDGTNYFVTLNENIPYISSGITYTFSIVRVSDSQQLWSGSGTVVPGSTLKLVLPGSGTPAAGDLVNVSYSFEINGLSRVIVDYNKGDLFIDYTYVADEILISYEYGDNYLDFRQNTNLPEGSPYYVSYKVGALRNALLKNFGTLVNVPELATFDLDLDRERYRDALMAALSSFIQGPTIAAIKNIGETISHIEPEVIESAFEVWSLGSSLLFPEQVQTTGSFQLLPAKYGNGVLIDEAQTIKLPVNSNLRLEEGTFEQWILPQWNGLDNDAELTFAITVDGATIAPYKVFIGASEYHPSINGATFTLDKNKNTAGKPNTKKDGVFIYYDKDISGSFNRWYIEVIDGYVSSNNHTYKFKINSTGTFYDLKSLSPTKPANMSIFTGTKSANITITSTGQIDEGITFLSDLEHYILDFGDKINSSRLSIFKDASGYMNFRVYDKDKKPYILSADVSSWKANESHMVAASWKLNTRNERDEMHLFIDGFEVPNIIRYGQKLQPYLHEKYRTVDPEEIVGSTTKDIVGSNDLVINTGSAVVTSSINFSAYHISPGDTIFIQEVGFNPTGYTISSISGQSLTLGTSMPTSLTNARFSVNQSSFTIASDAFTAPNIAVSTIGTFLAGSDLSGTTTSNVVTSTGTNFETSDVLPGYLLRVDNGAYPLTYTIVAVSGNTLTLPDNVPANITNAVFQIYSHIETELPGVNALRSDYAISQDQNFNNILTIYNGVNANDLILIRTFGLNSVGVKKQYYVWSDGYENVLMTRLPPPISLDQANIVKVVLPNVAVGPNNSTLSGGIFTSNNLPAYNTSNNVVGRTLTATLSGTNIDFTTPTQVKINGSVASVNTTETLTFNDYGSLDSVNEYQSVNYVVVITKPVNSAKNAGAVVINEKYSITHQESDGYVPVVKYSYHIGGGYNLLSSGGNIVTDNTNLFSGGDVTNYLVITSPAPVAGNYLITGISADRHSMYVEPVNGGPNLPSFSGATYKILNTNDYRSGLQNGFFTFEISGQPGIPYLLNSGFYQLEYETYARIKIKPLNTYFYIGSDMNGDNQANAILDQSLIYSIMLLDTRVGESIPNKQRSITKDFNSLKTWQADINTLVLLNFNTFPFTNDADFYISTDGDNKHLQSSWAVNDNFSQSVVILDKPIILANDGILDTRKEATIEFWMSPLFDTANDPQDRYYFDASGAIVEEAVSINNMSVKVSNPIGQVVSVKLAAGDPTIDYFAGGKLEIDTQRAIQENSTSIGNGSAVTINPILQIISVKISGDVTNTDYFANGTINSDRRTIYFGNPLPKTNLPIIITYQTSLNDNTKLNSQIIRLNRQLPAQNSKVTVTYLPNGMQGDRISIHKDTYGFMNFSIRASDVDYVVRGPTRWAKNTWHRIRASYKINQLNGKDEMRLFLDGYEYTNVLFGQGTVFGAEPFVMGSSSLGDGYGINTTIDFSDPINDLFIGTQYDLQSPSFTLLDNFRISNASRPVYAPYGEALDPNYSSNLDIVFPVTKDLYTTYLMDFNDTKEINTNFATLINRSTGDHDFTVNIFDSFGIVSGSAKVKEILEALIETLKPASSRAYIKYIK